MPEFMTNEVIALVNRLVESLYNEGQTVNNLVIQIPYLEEPFEMTTDYGKVKFEDAQ